MATIRWIAFVFKVTAEMCRTTAYAFDDWRWGRAVSSRRLTSRWVRSVRPQIENARLAHAMAAELDESADREVVKQRGHGGHGAILEDTGEFPIVYVSVTKRPGASAAKTARLAEKQRTKVDELGTWDPSECDWSTPALLFEATALERMSTLGRLANADDRLAVAGQVASYVLLEA